MLFRAVAGRDFSRLDPAQGSANPPGSSGLEPMERQASGAGRFRIHFAGRDLAVCIALNIGTVDGRRIYVAAARNRMIGELFVTGTCDGGHILLPGVSLDFPVVEVSGFVAVEEEPCV